MWYSYLLFPSIRGQFCALTSVAALRTRPAGHVYPDGYLGLAGPVGMVQLRVFGDVASTSFANNVVRLWFSHGDGLVVAARIAPGMRLSSVLPWARLDRYGHCDVARPVKVKCHVG